MDSRAGFSSTLTSSLTSTLSSSSFFFSSSELELEEEEEEEEEDEEDELDEELIGGGTYDSISLVYRILSSLAKASKGDLSVVPSFHAALMALVRSEKVRDLNASSLDLADMKKL